MAADKEIMKQIETLRLDRGGRVHRANAFEGGLTDALVELATTYREEAELWSKSGAKGWKTKEADLYVIAGAVDTVAAQLDNAGGGAALSVSEPKPGPVGQTAAATTHERLDNLVSSAVAEGRGMLRQLPEIVEYSDGTKEYDRGMLKVEIGPTATGETHDVTAYLKGNDSAMPGVLMPSSVTSGPETGNPFEPNPAEHPIAEDGTENPAADPIDLPKTWESETMSADGHVLPGVAKTLSAAPTLGQPGDNSGGGYSHDYIPPGGRRFTFADLLQQVPAAALPPHLSHSQGNTIGDCAAKYRMQRVDQLPQIPQWANIGGTAFHAAVEAFERMVCSMPPPLHREHESKRWDGYDVEKNWKHHFDATIEAVAATTTVPQSVWRASRKGAEGEAWWWVNGPKFLRAYLDARPDEVTIDIPVVGSGGIESVSGIEAELKIDVPTPYGPIPFTAKLDRVTAGHMPGRPEVGAIIIRDYKTSYERPGDTTQLGDYAQVLRAILARLGGPIADTPIYGSYFDARRGTWTEPVDLLAAHPFEAFQYRVTTAHAQKRALLSGPTPARPSSYCGGCSVRYACPVMASKG